MADEQAPGESTATETTAQPATPPAVQASPAQGKTYTQAEHQAEVDRIVKKRLGERVEPKVEARTEVDTEKLSKKDLKTELDQMRAEIARDRARLSFEKTASKLGVSDDAIDDLFDLHDRQKPEDTKTWLESKQGKLWTKAQAAAPAQPQVESLARPAVAAPNAPTGANNPVTSQGIVDIWNLSDAQRVQLGSSGIRAEFEKALAVGRQQSGAPPRPIPAPQRK